jgi:four helix bundle protein
MDKEDLKRRTKEFALRTFRFLMTLEQNKVSDVISYQLLKASSSVAANYRAACRGKSSADFLNKLKTVDEETDESLFWLEFISELGLKCDKKEIDFFVKEANELVAIFSSAIRTIKSKILIPKS